MRTVEVRGMFGLGDGVYQRPFVAALAERECVWLRTPWPEIYEDLAEVFFLPSPTVLRTQYKNHARQPMARWTPLPAGGASRVLQIRYTSALAHGGSMVDGMAERFGVPFRPELFTLPAVPHSLPMALRRTAKPLALLRPVTVRAEWNNVARNPHANYIAEAAAILRERFHVVSIADLEVGKEWLLGNPPPADATYYRGELPVRSVLALVQAAAVIVGGVGWIAPAAVAGRRSLVLIGGGQGGHNAPEKIFSPMMDTSRVRWVLPDHYCRCTSMQHACDKMISDFGAKFRLALTQVVPA